MDGCVSRLCCTDERYVEEEAEEAEEAEAPPEVLPEDVNMFDTSRYQKLIRTQMEIEL